MRDEKMKRRARGHTLHLSVLLALLALVSSVAATMAWFSIADFARLNSMRLDITSGYALRIDTEAHDSYEEYRQSISLAEIVSSLLENVSEGEYMQALQPVTTADGKSFEDEYGGRVTAESGEYLEFTVHFMANKDMLVHLTSEGEAGTRITSSNPQLAKAMRVSFTVDDTCYIYHPGMGDAQNLTSSGKIFGLPPASEMVMNEINVMWAMKKDVDVPVTIRVWLEGTDPACNNEIQGADYQLQFRFEGSDSEHRRFSGNE